MSDIEPRWLTAGAAAEYVCCTRETLRNLVKRGALPAPSYQFGPRSPRYDRLAIDARLAGRAAASNADAILAEGIRVTRTQRRPRRQEAAS
jgi:hypothetical protein